MTIKHAEKLNEEFDKLSEGQKLAFYEEQLGELLWEIWKDYDEEQFKEELKFIRDLRK